MKNIMVGILLICSIGLFGQSAEDIINKVDNNSTFDTYRSEGKIVIEGKYGKRTSEFTAYAKGVNDSVIEFLSGEEEGQKIFKTADDLYIKYPYAEEIQRLSKRKTLGAVSYDEMSGERDTLKNYNVQILSEKQIDGADVWVIEMIAKTSKVAHYKQKLFIDKSNYVPVKILYYSKSGKLTKEMLSLKVEEVGDKYITTQSIVTDKLKKNNSTESFLENIEVDIEIDDSKFSLDELAW